MYSKEQRKSWGEIEEFCRKLAKQYKARLVLVFGSTVSGEWTESSDVDIMVISDALPKNYFERFIEADYPEFEPQIFGYTTREIKAMLSDLNMFVIGALDEGVIVYSEGGYGHSLKQRVSDLKKQHSVRKTDKGWMFKIPA